MAERRMFAKTIIDSDAFLDMPASARLLYYDLGMRADDDGFVNGPKKIMRTVGASDDDIKLLIAKKFIIPFESGVVVIKHWKIHNYIQKDRYTETKYKEELSFLGVDENNAYTVNAPGNVSEPKQKKPLTAAQQKRLDAKNESELPYSFDYKMRNAFVGEVCPVCGVTMGVTEFSETMYYPTIQHNIPISKGGKHELSNISVICRSCNSTIQDKETPPYNSDKVREIWARIGNGSGMDTQDRLEIGKDRISKDIYIPPDGSKSVKQIKRKYGEYDNVKLTDDEFEKLNSEYGNGPTKRAIEYLSCYREEKGYKNRSDYLAMKRWVYDASKKNQSSNPFKEALRKELEDERQRSESPHVGYQGGLSKLLQEPDGD